MKALFSGGLIVLSSLLLMSAWACGSKDKTVSADSAPEEVLVPVETIIVEEVNFTKLVTLVGETEADESVKVSAEMSGLVVSTNFQEGMVVEQGHSLARLDVRTDSLRAKQLRDGLNQAERDLARAIVLEEKGMATKSDVERARMNVRTTKSNLSITRVGVGKSAIKAPIGGVIDQVYLKKGEFAMPGQPVVTIVNSEKIIIRAGLPESQLKYAKEGAAIKVMIPALDLERDGVVKRIGLQANSKNRTFPLQVVVDNEDGAIRSGMRAMVKLPTQRLDKALMVPREVVLDTPDGKIVYLVVGGKASRRKVTLGPDSANRVVLTRGIKLGDEVVIVGQHGLPRSADVDVVGKDRCCRKQMEGGE
jgi:RND family efflux transporter MFP subunit